MANKTTHEHSQLTGAFDLFSKSKDLVMQNLSIFAMLYAIPFVLQIMSVISEKPIESKQNTEVTEFFSNFSGIGIAGVVGLGAIVVLTALVVSILIQVMLYILELDVTKDLKPTVQQLWDKAKRYWLRVIGLSLLIGIMFVGGLILFIVPGLIVLRRYFLAPYYLIDQDLSISEAMGKSAAESKQYSGSIWGIIGVMILIGFVNIIPIVGWIISFALMAAYSVAPALRYRELKALHLAGDK